MRCKAACFVETFVSCDGGAGPERLRLSQRAGQREDARLVVIGRFAADGSASSRGKHETLLWKGESDLRTMVFESFPRPVPALPLVGPGYRCLGKRRLGGA